MVVVVVVWVENGGDETRMGWAASEGDGNGGFKAAGRGDENDAGNPAFAVF